MNAKTTAKTSFKDLRKAAVDLLPLAAAEADEAENAYHLTDKLVDEFRGTGLLPSCCPRPWAAPNSLGSRPWRSPS